MAQLPQLELEKFADWFAEFQETVIDKAMGKQQARNGLSLELHRKISSLAANNNKSVNGFVVENLEKLAG